MRRCDVVRSETTSKKTPKDLPSRTAVSLPSLPPEAVVWFIGSSSGTVILSEAKLLGKKTPKDVPSRTATSLSPLPPGTVAWRVGCSSGAVLL